MAEQEMLFTVSEARSFVARGVAPLDDAGLYPDDAITAKEAEIRELFEQACRVAFLQTETTETLDGADSPVLHVCRRNPLKEVPPRPLTVSAASIEGVELTAGELAALRAHPSGRIVRTDGGTWRAPSGVDDLAVSLTYTHGWASVPEQIHTAALLLCVRRLAGSDVPEEAVSFSDGGASYQFPRPGQAPHWTGYDAVDAVLLAFREARVVFA